MKPFDVDQMMELDMDVHHHDTGQPIAALSTMADALPGLGIVAAVLGVVITMGALGGPREEIGHKVAAALVGTFLGVLLCYGFIGPIAGNMAKSSEEEHAYYHVLRVVMVSFMKGTPPTVAVEFAKGPSLDMSGRHSRKLKRASKAVVVVRHHRRKPQPSGGAFSCPALPPSLSKRKSAMAAIMAAHGKWLTPIL